MDDLTALAVAAARGDRQALDRFIRGSQGDVWRYCRHMIGAAAADDVTQETYVRAIRALPSFQARSSARTWLTAIARRSCADWVRSQQRSRRLRDRLESFTDSHDWSLSPAGHVDLDMLVELLSDDRREAFVLTQVLGFSYEDSARICGCAVGTIRSRIARARLDLVEHLEGTGNKRRAMGD